MDNNAILIREYQSLNSEIIKTESEITRIKERFEKKLDSYIKDVEFLKSKKEKIKNNCGIAVRLVDLINSLAKISEVNVTDIGVIVDTNISTWGKYNTEDLKKLICTHSSLLGANPDYRIIIRLYANKKQCPKKLDAQKFNYVFSFPLNLDAIQCDGKRLSEHLVANRMFSYSHEYYYTEPKFDIDYNHLIVNLDFDNFIKEDNRQFDNSWYPAELFNLAVLNLNEKRDETEPTYSYKNSRNQEIVLRRVK